MNKLPVDNIEVTSHKHNVEWKEPDTKNTVSTTMA